MGQKIAREIYSGVQTRFTILSDGVLNETATGKYGRFTKAISDTTEELIPKVTRTSKVDPSQDSRVIQSRETVAPLLQRHIRHTIRILK